MARQQAIESPEAGLTWYHTEERVAALVAEARRWLGTPFLTNGKTCGEAVDCHNLTYALHRATGAWPAFEVPRGRSGIAGQMQVRRMSQFFVLLPFMRLCAGDPLPGDVLTARWHGVEAHMVTYLGRVDGQEATCVTALRGGVRFVNMLDPSWGRDHLQGIWRTVSEEGGA